jgi:hypothetical protein
LTSLHRGVILDKKIDEIVAKWIPQDQSLTSFYDGINCFVENNIDAKQSHDDDQNKSTKIIADPLIDYIGLVQ